jgi:hypothetical protein
MSADYDATEFIDGDFEGRPSPYSAAPAGAKPASAAPTRAEVDAKVAETQNRLAELKRTQEDLERQRAALEETRRRQIEFQTGRHEIVEHLTRGLGLLEEAEFNARRDAEQMAKALVGLREALDKVQAVHEETWTQDSFAVELTRALTALESARMEWNTARLKFPLLSGTTPEASPATPPAMVTLPPPFGPQSFGELCRVGFALTWPLAAVVVLSVFVLVILLRH